MQKVLNENELLEFVSKMTKEDLRKCFSKLQIDSPWQAIKRFSQDEIEYYVSIYRNKINEKIPLEALFCGDFSVYCNSDIEATDLLFQLEKNGYTWSSGALIRPYKNCQTCGRYYVLRNKTIVTYTARTIADYDFNDLIVESSVTPEEVESYIAFAKEMSEEDFAECFEVTNRLKLKLELVEPVECMEPHYLKRCIETWKDKKAFQVGDVVKILDSEELGLADDIEEEGFVSYVYGLDEMYISFFGSYPPVNVPYEMRQYIKNTGRKVVIKNA